MNLKLTNDSAAKFTIEMWSEHAREWKIVATGYESVHSAKMEAKTKFRVALRYRTVRIVSEATGEVKTRWKNV